MRVNVDKVLERDQRLSELDDRADALQAGASQFESSAAKLKNKYWWKNLKVCVCVCLCVYVTDWVQIRFSYTPHVCVNPLSESLGFSSRG